MKKHIFTIIVGMVIAASLLFYLFSFQVRSNETAVVLTFGKAAEKVREAGIHLQWPWPIQEVRRFDTWMHVYEGASEEFPTKDQFNIVVSACVGWKIKDFIKYNVHFGGGDPAKGIASAQAELKRIVRNRLNATMTDVKLDDLVSLDRGKLKHKDIEDDAKKLATADALQIYGIEVVLLKIRRLELPETVKNDVYNRMRTERNSEAQKITNRGKTKAEAIKKNAKAEAQEIKSRAMARAKIIMSEGERKASAHYEAFKKYPELAIYLKEVEAFKQIAKDRTTLVLDPRSPAVRVLVEPPPTIKK